MKARDIMEPAPVWVRTSASLWDAARRMLEAPFSTLPVVGDDDERLVGVLTMDDLLPRLEPVPFSDVEALRLFEAWLDENNYDQFASQYRQTTVEAHMREDVHTVAPEAHICKATRTLVDSGDSQVFVVDDDRRLLGVIGRNDVLRVLTSIPA